MKKGSLSNSFIVQSLDAIDCEIASAAQKLAELCKVLNFEHVLEFTLSENVCSIPDFVCGQNGVYFFQIKSKCSDVAASHWCNEFAKQWKTTDAIWFPGIKKIRVESHDRFKEWVPLYIGKSKNVGYRIHEHIHQAKHRQTFSMKLQARSNLHGEEFRVSWLPLNVKNYNMIAPWVENYMRNRFNPIAGRQ